MSKYARKTQQKSVWRRTNGKSYRYNNANVNKNIAIFFATEKRPIRMGTWDTEYELLRDWKANHDTAEEITPTAKLLDNLNKEGFPNWLRLAR